MCPRAFWGLLLILLYALSIQPSNQRALAPSEAKGKGRALTQNCRRRLPQPGRPSPAPGPPLCPRSQRRAGWTNVIQPSNQGSEAVPSAHTQCSSGSSASGWAGFVVLNHRAGSFILGSQGSWREELHTRHSHLQHGALWALSPGAAPQPREQTHLYLSYTDGRRRLAKCKGVAKGYCQQEELGFKPSGAYYNSWPPKQARNCWIGFLFFFKIQRNKRGRGRKKRKDVFSSSHLMTI